MASIDRDHILKAAELIMAPDAIHEVRALDVLQPNGNPRTVFGYFNNAELLAEAAANLGQAAGIYITLNPCRSELLVRSPNRLRIAGLGDATSDVDVLSRRWLFIDADPVRPKRTSATAAEVTASLDRCKEIGRWLRETGWPESVLAMSGNGGHILGRVDLPADDGGVIKEFLCALSCRFSDSSVKIDTAVHNAARISKLYGTIAAKGANASDRPHRRAELLHVPAELEVIQRDLLERCIVILGPKSQTQVPPRRPREANSAASSFEEARDRWLNDHPVEYPTAVGTCPACKHNGCFHVLPSDPNRWICFSDDHGSDSSKCGVEGREGRWSGDELDLAAHQRALSTTDVLREDGYLSRPDARVGRQPRPDRDDRQHTGEAKPSSGEPVNDGHEAQKKAADLIYVDSPRTPDVAREFARDHHLIARYAGDYYAFEAGGSTPINDEALERDLWLFLERARYVVRVEGKRVTKKVVANSGRVHDCKNALIARVALVKQAPCWLDGRTGPAPADIAQVGNGLLHLPERRLLPPDRSFFTTTRIATKYIADGPEPVQWLHFLDEIFARDRAAIDLLQEWFGYVISGRTDLQKILLLIGAIRCGKGTIARVLRALLGLENVAAPSLSTLYRDFALGAMLHKTLAIFPDARINGRPENNAVVLERLLSISGEDTVDVDRKFKPVVSVQLPIRFMILSNELPSIADASGALASRFLMLPLSESFLGREEKELSARLIAEIEAIMRWSLNGLERLLVRGHFVQPESGANEAAELRDLTSPASQFVDECCQLGASHEETTDELFGAYRWWCGKQNQRPGTKAVCMRDLRNAVRLLGTRLKPHSPRIEGGSKRQPMLQGIGLLPEVREKVAASRSDRRDVDGEPPF